MADKMKQERLRVLIIGCGKIAGAYDAHRGNDASPLTHANAFKQHGGYSLEACVEPDLHRRSMFTERWSVREGFESVEAIGNRPGAFDVISICSPTQLHPQHLESALRLGPKLIFCEKPISLSVETSRELVAKCNAARVPLAINYIRRWDPDVHQLRTELDNGTWGPVRSIVGHYNKGLFNNGSHLIDLLSYFFGPLEVKYAGSPVFDYWDEDPSIPAWLKTTGGIPIQLNVGHALDYTYFELQILTQKALITMEDGGLYWRVRRPKESSLFSGTTTLDAGIRYPGHITMAMSHAASNIHDALIRGTSLESTGDSALEAQVVCDNIRILSQSHNN